MLHKSIESPDATVDVDAGTFEATVAIFNNVDKGGDRIKPGAFAKTLARWAASGDPIPVIFNHDWGTPDAHIGVVDEAVETEKGLFVKGTLDIADNPVAKQVHRLMARRSLKEFSFGYSIPQGGEKRAKDGATDLLEIDLAEVGPTLKGMNPATELHAVKSALGVEEPKDPDVLREEAKRVAREEEEARLPDVPVAEDEVKASLDALKAEIEKQNDFAEQIHAPENFQLKKYLADVLSSQIGGRDKAPSKSVEELRRETRRVQREHHDLVVGVDRGAKNDAINVRAEVEAAQEALMALELFEPDEVAGLRSGLVKAAWTAAYINDLPDSAFLYIEPGGNKDDQGKTTPRSLRHFPYRDAAGAVDLPHLRNALSRIPQSSLPQDVKDRATAKAQRLLDSTKSVDVTDKEPTVRSVDPLRKQADQVALEFAADGLNLHKPPAIPAQKKPEPELDLGDLKKRMREEILVHLSGGTLQ